MGEDTSTTSLDSLEKIRLISGITMKILLNNVLFTFFLLFGDDIDVLLSI